ncbi:hypothetical protein EV126DRAFT_434755 [Verticillium dahliae]|nr:hypothetical protein EV126DRAFT_436629 [Verticillium dahliae]KAH6685193.1 hypothetical protein EV126DRAFT_434755 [Verticillium dahliae]
MPRCVLTLKQMLFMSLGLTSVKSTTTSPVSSQAGERICTGPTCHIRLKLVSYILHKTLRRVLHPLSSLDASLGRPLNTKYKGRTPSTIRTSRRITERT